MNGARFGRPIRHARHLWLTRSRHDAHELVGQAVVREDAGHQLRAARGLQRLAHEAPGLDARALVGQLRQAPRHADVALEEAPVVGAAPVGWVLLVANVGPRRTLGPLVGVEVRAGRAAALDHENRLGLLQRSPGGDAVQHRPDGSKVRQVAGAKDQDGDQPKSPHPSGVQGRP